MQFPDRGRKQTVGSFTANFCLALRNVVPRQGTETRGHRVLYYRVTIEKCSSPTGDGNFFFAYFVKSLIGTIEKCSSPTGDGNSVCFIKLKVICTILRNVVPRQGTETIPPFILSGVYFLLRNVVPRQGTETTIWLCMEPASIQLRNVVPRQGTETLSLLM